MAPSKSSPADVPAAVEPPKHTRVTRRRRPQSSANALYEAVMRLGGEPFLAPFAVGLTSLTRGVVARLKQRGFFGLESFERSSEGINGGRPNKFTRFGASPFNGDYEREQQRLRDENSDALGAQKGRHGRRS